MTFTNIFGGSTIYQANPTYRAFALSANVTLEWATEAAATGNVVADIMDVTPSGAGFTVRMPPANEASVGESALFFNVGGSAFTVADNGGNTIASVGAGQAWQVYLTSNATANGAWRATQYGAGTSTATAGSLVGAGIKAIGTTLNQAMSNTTLTVNYTVGDADRSEVFNWAGGAGTLTLPSAATVGSDWFIHTRNSGTGGLTIATSVGGQNINGASSLILNPGDSAIVFCDGANFFTIGLGRSAAFAFDFVSIDLTGQPTPYILSGANLNRVAYRFTGTLTFNVQVIVPDTVQQYWVSNDTDLASAPYNITVKTLAGTGVSFARNERAIVYSDGTNVIDADSAGISLPLSVSQGGTGATTESGARINLGGTATGISLFTAASASAARNTLGSTVTGDALFTAASASAARTTLGANTVGSNIFTLANPSAITFLRVNADNTASLLDAASFRTAIGSVGTVTSVSGAGTVNGLTLTGTVTGSGSLTLGGTLSGVSLTSAVTGTLPVANGGTGATTLTGVVKGNGTSAFTAGTVSLTSEVSGTLPVASGGTGTTTVPTNGQLLIGNGSGYTVASLTAGSGITITPGAGTITIAASGGGGGGVSSVDVSGGATGLTFSGGPITSSGTITMAGTLAVANGGTGATTAANARTNLGATTVGSNIFTLTNPGSVSFITINADNTVSARSASQMRSDLGLGSMATVNSPVPVGNGGTGATTFTANYLLKGNGTSAVSSSQVFDNGTSVGIGTATPATKLDVYGGASGTDTRVTVGNAASALQYGVDSSNNGIITTSTTNPIIFFINGSEVMRYQNGGSITSADVADAVGYKGLPQNGKTANYTLALSDQGKDIYITGTTAAQTITIPANSSVAFPVGTVIQVTNDSNQNWSIAITSDTLLWSPNNTTGTRTLAAAGQCTLRKVASTRWWISGVGLT